MITLTFILSTSSLILAFLPKFGVIISIIAIIYALGLIGYLNKKDMNIKIKSENKNSSNTKGINSKKEKTNKSKKKKLICLSLLISVFSLVLSMLVTSNIIPIHFGKKSTPKKSVLTKETISAILTDKQKISSQIQKYMGDKITNDTTLDPARILKDIKTGENTNIFFDSAKVENITPTIKEILAISGDNTKIYYNIDFSKIECNIGEYKKSYWVFDNLGNVYLNIEDICKY
ncbi:MAG: hypothetical protein RSE00_00320 [Clostridia bacterium]